VPKLMQGMPVLMLAKPVLLLLRSKSPGVSKYLQVLVLFERFFSALFCKVDSMGDEEDTVI